VGLPSALIIFAGHMAVVIGLWPVHVFCTYRTLAMTKKLGIVVKVLSLLLVPIPLLLWPCVVVICSLLGGLGYGFGQPLVATFEAVGENRNAKFYHSLMVCDVTTIFMSSMMFLYVCLCITIDVRHGWVPCQVGVHFLPLVLQFFRKSSVLC
jgi:hypothetical protein